MFLTYTAVVRIFVSLLFLRVLSACAHGRLLYNIDMDSNVVGFITDCAGEFDAILGMSGSTAVRGECDLVSSSGNLYFHESPIGRGTLPWGSHIFTVPSNAEQDLSPCHERVCEFEGKRWRFDRSRSVFCEQSMKSARE